MASEAVRRLLNPRSVAIVGASDGQVFARGFTPTLEAGVDMFFVHPKRPSVFGHDTVPTLRDLERPVDAVMCFANADQTLRVVEDAGAIGAGGVVCVAAGFAETGTPEGAARQAELRRLADASGLAINGPNGTGFINVHSGVYLSITSPLRRKPGGISLISASGGMVSIATEAAKIRGLGFSYLLSPGNEAVIDLADYVDFVAEDPNTQVIALIIESIRRPDAFFAAADRAMRAGKPIVALRFGRTETARKISQSHTGSVVEDSWVYDVALRQAGIELASDVDDLMDRVQLFEELEPRRWTAGGIAVVTASGGTAGMMSDIASDEGVELPALEQLAPYVESTLEGINTANPLDMTGFIVGQPDLFRAMVERYLDQPEVGALLNVAGVTAAAEAMSGASGDMLADIASQSDKAVILCGMNATPIDPWVDRLRTKGVAIGNGPRGTMRSLSSIASYVRNRERILARRPVEVPATAQPAADVVRTATGVSLPFDACMELLASVGIPVAPYRVFALDETVDADAVGFDGPYVLKLADLPHRTDHGAVRVGVEASDVGAVAAELRELARTRDLPPRVVVQPMVAGTGEAFIGITTSELGPMVVCGVGGVLVEVLKAVAGRFAPIDEAEAQTLLDELVYTRIFEGFRGAPPWDREELATILVAASRLAAATSGWLESLDINPLIFGPTGFQAVDGLALVASNDAEDAR